MEIITNLTIEDFIEKFYDFSENKDDYIRISDMKNMYRDNYVGLPSGILFRKFTKKYFFDKLKKTKIWEEKIKHLYKHRYRFKENDWLGVVLYIKQKEKLPTIKSVLKNKLLNVKIKLRFNYIYLIEQKDANDNSTIYKFGYTNRKFELRLKEHGLTSKTLLHVEVEDAQKYERICLNEFKNDNNIKNIPIMGKEYFKCFNKSYFIKKIMNILIKLD
tara:strand:+ start:227 stop:877 length:651 start_codon:yes stop_codon:yes gene_type:complete